MSPLSKSSPPEGWVKSDLKLPTPELQLDFRICVQLNPIIPVGEGPWGKRNWISFKGGQWSATWGEGTVEVIAYSTPSLRRNGALTTLTARRSRLATSPSRLAEHFRLDKLSPSHGRRGSRFHRCPNDWLAHRTTRRDGAAV